MPALLLGPEKHVIVVGVGRGAMDTVRIGKVSIWLQAVWCEFWHVYVTVTRCHHAVVGVALIVYDLLLVIYLVHALLVLRVFGDSAALKRLQHLLSTAEVLLGLG